MQLVEQHRIDRHDPRWATIDAAAFASKNLYNAALYLTRQAYIADHTVLTYRELDRLLQPTAEYRALPAKVAQWVLKQVCLAWTSYFAACREWEANPRNFKAIPSCQSIVTNRDATYSPIQSRSSAAIPRTLAG